MVSGEKRGQAQAECSSKKTKIDLPKDVDWCISSGTSLSFKAFVEKFEPLDRRSAEQRFTNIATNSKYFKSGASKIIMTNFKTWTNSADYLIFWSKRMPKNNMNKIVLEMDEVIDKVAT
ncbi:hypothetical protein RMCBS344292_15798 [Rhizopus microsporus]|nr:hypothetical protein RMCBS344292_15798 [Rhizopus microsporus]